MRSIADSLSEKISVLTPAQIAAVEVFVEFLHTRDQNRMISRAAGQLSEPAFATVWSNPEDDAYDEL